MRNHIFATAFILLWVAMSAQAQKIKSLEKTYTYTASHNESREQAERNAVNRAKVEALREAFGSTISGASAMSLITKNNITTSKFVTLSSEGEVNGEWISEEKPEVSTMLADEGFIVIATVRGKARELQDNGIDFTAKILRNAPDVHYVSSEFTAGDQIFVHFTSPVDGYLAVYLLDGENAYCLLPYMDNATGNFPITHGEEYILFSRKHPAKGEDPHEIDEYPLTADGGQPDLNQLYFIFSPKEFTKATDSFKQKEDGTLLPRTLSWTDFQKWLLRIRRNDKQMTVQTQYIIIQPLS